MAKSKIDIGTYVMAFEDGKGGVGKTTAAIYIAYCLKKMGYKVLIIDRDPQGTAVMWHNIRNKADWRFGEQLKKELPEVRHVGDKNIARALQEIKGYDIFIIDGSAKIDELMSDSICAADLVLIPFCPQPFDTWGATQTLDIVIDNVKANPDTRVAFILNKYVKNKHTRAVVSELENKYHLPVLTSTIRQYSKIAYTKDDGVTVFNFKNKACEIAAPQFMALTEEIIGLINNA